MVFFSTFRPPWVVPSAKAGVRYQERQVLAEGPILRLRQVLPRQPKVLHRQVYTSQSLHVCQK